MLTNLKKVLNVYVKLWDGFRGDKYFIVIIFNLIFAVIFCQFFKVCVCSFFANLKKKEKFIFMFLLKYDLAAQKMKSEINVYDIFLNV